MSHVYGARAPFWAAFLLALAFGAGHAVNGASGQHGEPHTIMAGGYETDAQSAAKRADLAVVDTLTTSAILATSEVLILGKQTLTVSARFSQSGQTCQVQVAYVHKDNEGKFDGSGSSTSTTAPCINTIKTWSSVVTLTGSSSQKEGSYYESPVANFDGDGAVAARVLLIAAPSSGTVSLWVGSK